MPKKYAMQDWWREATGGGGGMPEWIRNPMGNTLNAVRAGGAMGFLLFPFSGALGATGLAMQEAGWIGSSIGGATIFGLFREFTPKKRRRR
jgi:hypothetical protein